MHPIALLLTGLTLAAPVKTHHRAAACSIVGSFGNTIGHNGHVTMTNTGTAQAGKFAIVITLPNGRTTNIRGDYTAAGNQMKMINTSSAPAEVFGCIGMPSVYTISFSPDCSRVTFNKISDACPGRIMDANGKTLTRAAN